MSKRGRKHRKLVECRYGLDDKHPEYCCDRKEWYSRGMTMGWHRCELYDGKPCPFGKEPTEGE